MAIRIILADDHAVFRHGLCALLEKEEDFEVVGEASNGIEAMKLLEEVQADVLILDISMPGLSGSKVAHEVIKKYPSTNIVILTMHEDEYYLQELLRIGVQGYVLKKSTGTELLQALRSVSLGNSYVDPALVNLVITPYVGRSKPNKPNKDTQLTRRESEICKWLAYGYTNAEVAEKLFISHRTVETHRTNIMAKLGLKSRAELVRFAIDNDLLKME